MIAEIGPAINGARGRSAGVGRLAPVRARRGKPRPSRAEIDHRRG
jgi:hypothetical protein